MNLSEPSRHRRHVDSLQPNASRPTRLLVARAKDGDTLAFVELGERHSTKVLRTVFRITRNREDAEDALPGSSSKGFQTSEWLRKQKQFFIMAYQNSDQFRANDFAKEESVQRNSPTI